MLATSTFSSSSPHNFLPVIPSPLSPRRASHGKYHPRLFSDFMTSQPPSDTPRTQQPFSSRPIKPVPTAQKSDALRERRRDIFLKKIKQTRDDSRWEARTEDMARLDYITQKRRWEAEQARLAPPTYSDPSEEAENENSSDLPYWGSQMAISQPVSNHDYEPSDRDREADVALQQEDAELEALLSLMQQQGASIDQELEAETTPEDASVFGSDDDEYDSIFMDFIDDQGNQAAQSKEVQDEEMDMT